MISLFIDTSLEDVFIALVKDGKELSQIHEYIPGKHSIYVTKYISDILKNNNLSPDNVDEIIVVNGPGSFTGIRIGVTIAKMFAYIKKIRIVTITSLKARVLGHTGNYLLTTIDAKHNNYYVGVYDKEYNTIEEKFTSFKEVEELKEKYSPVVIDQTTPYQVEQIVSYTKKLKSENPHGVNPIYLKLPEAMEKKC